MSFYSGLTFFIILLLGCIPAVLLGMREKKIGNYAAVFSGMIIFLVYREHPSELFYLCVYLILECHLITLYQWSIRRFGKIQAVFRHAVLLALLPLAAAKLGGWAGHECFSFLGISYVTFKVLQIIIESYDGMIEKSDFKATVSFLYFFPTLSSGPIDRSRRFEKDFIKVWSREEYIELLQKGIWKLLIGILYKFVLSAAVFDLLEKISGRYDPQYLILYAYGYGIYMFFDFAGYSLMAVGTGYVLGICTPDNFNKPFISKDMKDFWNRWHISLSHWFRDFVFSRYVAAAIRNKKYKSRMNAASAGFLVNMLLMGLWHGLTADYLLYGLYHGVLLAITEIYQKQKWYRRVKKCIWYQCVSWFVTLNMVMFGFLIFSGRFLDSLAVLAHYL